MGSQPGSKLTPKAYKTGDLKSKILKPALTSTYSVYFNVTGILDKKTSATQTGTRKADDFFGFRGAKIDGEFLSISCSEASLPGSSLATNEINNDYTGVTERHAYRRIYDDRADFTFYVDSDYSVLKFFETWISWIVGEDQLTEQSNYNYNYRVKFPSDYRVDMHIQKFERDYKKYVEYTFIGAYPISITSMPVSYDSSQLLKCTVSFTYTRYFLGNVSVNPNSQTTPSTEEQTNTLGQQTTQSQSLNTGRINTVGQAGALLPLESGIG